MTELITPDISDQSIQPALSPGWRFGLAGLLSAAVALAIGELIASVVFSIPSPIVSIGNLVIDTVPPAVKDWAIAVFGTADKLVLILSILAVAGILGFAVGRLARRTVVPGIGVIAGFGLFAIVAMLQEPDGSATLIIGTIAIAVVLAIMVLRRLTELARSADATDTGRRTFLVGAGSALALAAGAVAVGRWFTERARQIAENRADVALPTPRDSLPALAADADLAIDGLSPIITPVDDFYRIDTALTVPMINLNDWTMSIRGLVDRPLELNYDDLLAMDLVERDITIACVSNRVGGDLIGTARWLGVPLDELLLRAGVQDDGTQLVGRSVDDFTVGFPTQIAMDGRNALVAVGMNGEPLPFDHGFPARLVVSGLYGYVSATKWLKEIEITTWDAFDAYWIPRGWSKVAPIKLQSRVDTPRPGQDLDQGSAVIAGVAWAQNTGISGVEVQLDGGEWRTAELGPELSIDTWRQWSYVDTESAPGRHIVSVRAIDVNGQVQTAEEVPPRPDGATGYHTVSFDIA